MEDTLKYCVPILCGAYKAPGIALILITLGSQSLQAQVLGSASNFGVLGGSTVTNTGSTVVTGDVGVSPGSAVTGFPPGSIIGGGSLQLTTALANTAQTDVGAAITALNGETPTMNLTGDDLGGRVLTPGVYVFDSSAQLTGTLTLNAQNDPNARFDFIIGSTLTTASASSVVLENEAEGGNVYWDVGSSATLGTTTSFEGNVLATASITATTGATDGCGSLLAHTGAVTLDDNTIGGGCVSYSNPDSNVPEPSSALLLAGLAGAGLLGRRQLRNRRNRV